MAFETGFAKTLVVASATCGPAVQTTLAWIVAEKIDLS